MVNSLFRGVDIVKMAIVDKCFFIALCPVFSDIQGLILKTAGLADVVRRVLSPLAKDIEKAFIYGSHADGSATSISDVDLLRR